MGTTPAARFRAQSWELAERLILSMRRVVKWSLLEPPGDSLVVFLYGAGAGWSRSLEKSFVWAPDGCALLSALTGGCLGSWAASGAWGRADGTRTQRAGHGAAGSRPFGTSLARGLLESTSLVLSSWESPRCPSKELWLCLGCGNSQAAPWAERASPGLCA